jgi:hypothetical protein
MTDLTTVIHDVVEIFDQLRLPYAIMGGIGVQANGILRPTYDVDCSASRSSTRCASRWGGNRTSSGWPGYRKGLPVP